MKTQPTYGAAERFSRHYGYDAAGRRSYMAYGNPATNPGGQAYHYDARGQLTHARFLATGNPATAVPTTNPTHQFSFDASGNRQSAVTPALGTVNYTSNSTNAYTMVTGDQPAYDANGNTTRLRGRTLAWDRKNRMRSNGNIEYIYDALGRMVQRKDTATGETHRYSWSGWLMLGERKKDASGAETEYLRYTWGADLTGTLEGAGTVGGLLMVERFAGGSGTAQVAHVHPDANGNTMGLTSDTGAVLAWYRYHPFGTLESSGGNAGWLSWNRFTFSTKWHDPTTGLHYYGYRWYDPVAGRWPSRDPIGEKGGLNLYAFVRNDGVNCVDKLGLKEVETNSSRMSSPLAIISFENHYFLKVDGSTFGFWPARGKKKLMSMLPLMWVKGRVFSPDLIGSGKEEVIKLDDCNYDIEEFNECMKDSAKAGPARRYNLLFNNCYHWREGVISKCMKKAKKK